MFDASAIVSMCSRVECLSVFCQGECKVPHLVVFVRHAFVPGGLGVVRKCLKTPQIALQQEHKSIRTIIFANMQVITALVMSQISSVFGDFCADASSN